MQLQMDQPDKDALFYSAVSEQARLPVGDARDLVSDFLNAISGFVGEDAWGVLVELAPDDVGVEQSDEGDFEGTVEEFLLEMSDVEAVEAGRAAQHARVVAETLRSRADESQLEELRESIENDELLALFELSRGELTEPQMPTAGSQAQSEDSPGSNPRE